MKLLVTSQPSEACSIIAPEKFTRATSRFRFKAKANGFILATITIPMRAATKLHRLVSGLVWKIRWGGKPHVEYHRHRMDSWGLVEPELAVGGHWDQIGPLQLRIMQAVGLQPQHRFLDLGAGSLRGGVHLIKYLEAGNYWGTDLSVNLLKAGLRNLEDAGLAAAKPNLLISKDFGFAELNGELFDFVLAFGVFTDIPVDSLRECFANLGKVLVPNGVFVATFALGSEYLADRAGLRFRYPWAMISDVAVRQGFSIRLVSGFQHPKSHSLFVARRK